MATNIGIKFTAEGEKTLKQALSSVNAELKLAGRVFGKAIAAVLNVPGQKMPTEKPHTAQPISPMTGLPDKVAVR